MSDVSAETLGGLSIAAVERDTGLSKDTLRVWERRYGFPQPLRDANGERLYSTADLARLRLLKRLLDGGHRPRHVVPLALSALEQLSRQPAAGAAAQARQVQEPHDRYLALLVSHDLAGLRRALGQALVQVGLQRFVLDHVAPLNALVGEAWMGGQIQVFEEHVYTEAIHTLLRNALGDLPPPSADAAPRVLLATLPQEAHGLGLLMAEALFSLQGCHCVSLGVQTPVPEIVAAAAAHEADIVAMSFSSGLNPRHALAGLAQLRERLPAAVGLWAGGQCAVIHLRTPAGVQALPRLEDITEELARWRAARAGAERPAAAKPPANPPTSPTRT